MDGCGLHAVRGCLTTLARDPVFELTKWYADCVSDDGEVLIGYSGQLHYPHFSLQYESVLAPPAVSHSLCRSAITADDSGIEWVSDNLDLHGRWVRHDAEIRETIYQSGDGVVEWRCMVPKGLAAIERSRHGSLQGWGYVEHLRLTIPPWRMPIRTLRWGRFLTERNTLVWIDWQGDFSSRIVYWNGRRIRAASIENHALSLEDGARATLDRGLVLRHGKLGSTVLHAIPGLERIAPSRIFLMDECKWRSHATLECAGEEADHGWCIHEEVTWP